MLSLSLKRTGELPALPSFASKLLPVKHAVSHFSRRVLVPGLGVAGLLTGAAMMLVAYGVIPFSRHASPHSTHPAAPAIVKAVAATSCKNSTAATTVFATCPSLALNFSKQPNGPVNTQVFNIYTGAPEANNEAEYYTNNSDNLRIQNGMLVLEAQNEPQQGYKYTSARVDTKDKEDFLYGKIVVRATVPSGIGTWPAIWMLPSNPQYASQSPASDPDRYMNDGEIDIMEAVGIDPHVVYGIAHARAFPENGTNNSYFNTITLPNNDTTLHDYEVDWTPSSLTFKVDGNTYFTFNKVPNANYMSWPFNQPFYLVLNLAVGGSWGGQDTAQFPGDGVNPAALPASMQVSSIMYYPYIGQQ